MSQAAKVQEPSMEEILASIRRIIADDEPKAPAKSSEGAQPGSPSNLAPLASAAVASAPAPSSAAAMSQAEVDAMMGKAEKPQPGGGAQANSKSEEGVLELTEAMAADQSEAPSFRTIEGESDVIFSEVTEEPAAAEPAAALEPASPPAFANLRSAPESALLSSATNAAVDAAFNALARTVLVQNARTLEDLVREMLRPMLKTWLDDNLPDLVERMVRAEIERVARGR